MPIAAVSGAEMRRDFHGGEERIPGRTREVDAPIRPLDPERGEVVIKGRTIVAAHGSHEAADQNDDIDRRP